MRPPVFRLAVVVALTSLVARGAAAQGTAPAAGPREVANNTNAWLAYAGDHAVSRRWAVLAEVQVRRSDLFDKWQQLLVRPGVAYTLTPAVRFAAGYAFQEAWPYGEQPTAQRFPEHRLWQQVQLTHATGRVAWQHRYRVEQRWIDVPLDAAARDRRYSNRARYLARATVPLRGPTADPGEPYAAAYDELFVSWGRNVGRNVFDQNRAGALLGWRFGATTRVEAGYLQQLVAKGNGVQLERNHTLQVTLLQSAPLFR